MENATFAVFVDWILNSSAELGGIPDAKQLLSSDKTERLPLIRGVTLDHLSNTIPAVMYGAAASCCVGVFQQLLPGSWSVMKKCWQKQRGLEQILNIRIQAQPEIGREPN